ncbi:MAG: Permease of the drug/metabolite transporter (DMT) superfamily [uncultured Gemmatimonadetes bacterium]|uniref:Permease of the drug/metabolite transporter (DMT) superfamily n=1 Tax=uncultured Gemmatimonadota bacterium TaxID=203437 RepID=A0A6J4MWV9_9BACT|nr:MAG: Permease of the drug/metabolite transporter (DMT) superfamily [uncultured Gemmatimonadota bacterium]
MILSPARRFSAIVLLALTAACADDAPGPLLPELPVPTRPRPHPDRALFLEAARGAWTYAAAEYQPATGLINSVAGYPYATVWDIASGLAAIHCAGELGLIRAGDADARLGRALATLESMRLFDGIAPNKNYSTATGAIAGRDDREPATERGYGWSSTDIGRLLVWLRIIAVQRPEHAATVRRIVARMDLSQIVRDGYLQGREVSPTGELLRYQEGRLGYEQYAAYGFALWGHRAESALRLRENAVPVQALGIPLLADRRGDDFLTSEPFILAGLELGWNREMAELANGVLAAQQVRFQRTGQPTFVSEDAIPRAPYYFYYYAVSYRGQPFVVGVQGTNVILDEPRWISAKAAVAWHALLPSPYTRLGIDAVAPARHPTKGWSSGVYESTRAPTGSENINTAAVVLQAALFAESGRPLVQ